jgi:hypothetical protein
VEPVFIDSFRRFPSGEAPPAARDTVQAVKALWALDLDSKVYVTWGINNIDAMRWIIILNP